MLPNESLIRGAVAGPLAAVPMTAVMLLARSVGLVREIPPRKVTRGMLRLLGVRTANRRGIDASALVAHLAYSAMGGILFAGLSRMLGWRARPVFQGVGYSLIVFVMSYMGWVPASGIMRSAEKQGKGWLVSTVAAHVTYGAVLGALVGRSGKQPASAPGGEL